MKKFVIIWGFVVAMLINGCLAVSPNEGSEDFMNSAIITSSVKARLANASGLETLSFTVETLNGTVLLSGFAQTQEQKDAAGRVADNTEGVQRVINHIVVQ